VPDLHAYLRICRVLLDTGVAADPAAAVLSVPIPPDLRDAVLAQLEAERVIRIRDPLMVTDPGRHHEAWLHLADRSAWYFWPRLREHLIDRRSWRGPTVMGLDRATDRILGEMENPRSPGVFRTQGLVVGHVQSGKTANYTALIAKAADCGYRLVIVLTGIHNSLRQQTQRRLTAELVGFSDGRSVGVGTPAPDRQWQTFTSSELNGDFNPGHANAAALDGNNRVLIVAKKVTSVLRAMNDWFARAQDDVLPTIPTLIIDDEADLATINTGGDRRPVDIDDDAEPPDETAPSRTNELIRGLVGRFQRVAYIAYTATPFANVLIDHRAVDRTAGEDLYPRSFIVALPRPPAYWGAERIFGLPAGDAVDADAQPALDVIRRVPVGDVALLVPARRAEVEGFQVRLADSLVLAIDDFVLAGAARIQRGDQAVPATMLVHTSYRTSIQERLSQLVADHVARLRDDWRYFRSEGIAERLRRRWETDFRRVIRSLDLNLDIPFESLAAGPIGILLEQLEVRRIHSGSLDELDYERQPDLKVIVIGGNRLSRGLTLEGLLVSYLVRPARNYDTLMQMGRWFGFRDGYADLTRIHTTELLEEWFRDLAMVEIEVREDIARYEQEGLTPLDFGIRIRTHAAMLVTSPLKMRHARVTDLSFSNKLRQTINFRFDDIPWLERNLEVTRGLLSTLGPPDQLWRERQPMWESVPWRTIIDFLQEYQMDDTAKQVRSEPIRSYIGRQVERGELAEWLVAVMGQGRHEPRLGPQLDLGIVDRHLRPMPANPIERTRVRGSSTLRQITSPADQEIGLTGEQIERARGATGRYGENLREERDPRRGALLIYPISRRSGHDRQIDEGSERVPIYEHPDQGRDIIGIALIFPRSRSAAARAYLVGTVDEPEE
jgi:hypothetical protein